MGSQGVPQISAISAFFATSAISRISFVDGIYTKFTDARCVVNLEMTTIFLEWIRENVSCLAYFSPKEIFIELFIFIFQWRPHHYDVEYKPARIYHSSKKSLNEQILAVEWMHCKAKKSNKPPPLRWPRSWDGQGLCGGHRANKYSNILPLFEKKTLPFSRPGAVAIQGYTMGLFLSKAYCFFDRKRSEKWARVWRE